jgi:putative ABC transport system permease protein
MIELRDVCKSYKVKNGPVVKALDHVNITFGEKGLVFILGKSGAGKSTMLNVIGGLGPHRLGRHRDHGQIQQGL